MSQKNSSSRAVNALKKQSLLDHRLLSAHPASIASNKPFQRTSQSNDKEFWVAQNLSEDTRSCNSLLLLSEENEEGTTEASDAYQRNENTTIKIQFAKKADELRAKPSGVSAITLLPLKP